jgi:hypothetical protein
MPLGGCNDYATKPIDPHELLLTIARWVATKPPVDDVAAALPKKPAGSGPDGTASSKGRNSKTDGGATV